MTITHVWDKDRTVAENFAARFKVPNVVDRYDGMAGKVEGVFQCGYKASYWSYELTRPYLESGAVVFVDRPGAYSVARARRMLEAAARHKAVVYWGNLHECHPSVLLMAGRARHLAPLAGVVADCLTDPEPRFYSLHCVHGIYMLYPLLEGMVRRVRTFYADEPSFSPVTLLECENADKSAFVAALHRQGIDNVAHEGMKRVNQPRERALHRGWLKIFGRHAAGEESVRPPASYGQNDSIRLPADVSVYFSLPALAAFERTLATHTLLQSEEQLLGKLRVFLASWKSLLEGGSTVEVAGLRDDWSGPNPYPDYFGSGYFLEGN